MKKRIGSLFLTSALLLTSVTTGSLQVNAAQSSVEEQASQAQPESLENGTKGAVTNNKGKQNYSRWYETVKSYLVANGDGTMTRVEYAADENVITVEKYSLEGEFIERRNLEMELPLFGGFYEGTLYNFFVFGQENPEEDDSVEVIRVVKYTKDWNRVKSVGLSGINTTIPFDAGSLRMVQYDNMLYVHTSHEMYTYTDGFNHQANLTFSVKISTMEVTDKFDRILNYAFGYVSHSFNQFILVNDRKELLTLDHGDSHPRGAVVLKYSTPAGEETFTETNGKCIGCLALAFEGENGLNNTGASLGGFEYSDTSYLVAGNSVEQKEDFWPHGKRDIFVTSIGIEPFGTVKRHWYTEYTDGMTASTPHLVKIDNNRFLLMWMAGDALQYLFLDGKGEAVGEIRSFSKGALSDCKPILIGQNVVWYTTSKDVPLFYSINVDSPDEVKIINGVHTLTYDLMGGEMEEDGSRLVTYDEPYGTLPYPQKEDSMFLGWYTSPEGNTRVTDTTKVTSTGDETLYARWMAKKPCGDNLKWNLDVKTGVLTISGNGSMYDFSFRSSPWYDYRNSIHKVVVENGVTSVGKYAFFEMADLTDVTLPESISQIGYMTFAGCTNLRNLKLPQNVDSLGSNVFQNCSSLTGIVVPNGVTNISYRAFSGCTGLTEVTLPESVKNISEYAFWNCTGLTDIVIPKSTETIGSYAFGDCDKLQEITLPESLLTLGSGAFYNCSSLTDVEIPNGTTTLGNEVFGNCTALKKITIPTTISSMGSEIFKNHGEELVIYGRKKSAAQAYAEKYNIRFQPVSYTYTGSCGDNLNWDLTDGVLTISGSGEMTNWRWASEAPWEEYMELIDHVVVNDGVTGIGSYAFYAYESISSVELPDSLTYIGRSAFHACRGLNHITIPDNVETIQRTAFYNCSSLAEIVIPEKIKTIEQTVFGGCTKLGKAVIPATVTSINSDAFSGHSESLVIYGAKNSAAEAFANANDIMFELISYEYSGVCGDNLTWTLKDGRLTVNGSGAIKGWNKNDENTWYPYRNLIDEAVIGEGITSLDVDAFANYGNLKKVNLPDSLLSIGKNAFLRCRSLNSISIPAGITRIENHTFYGCNSLKEITLPAGLTGIGVYSFWGCSSLREIEIPDGVDSIGDYAFNGCSSLSSVSLPESLENISQNMFEGCSRLRELEIPEGVQAIYYRAFNGCSSLSSVELPAGVKYIYQYAFAECPSLKKITIPDSVTSINKDAFSGHDSSLTIYGYKRSLAETYAEENEITFVPLTYTKNGTCGDNLTWNLTDDILTIDGTGKMTDWENSPNVPWRKEMTWIKEVVVKNGVTSIGINAFSGGTSIQKATLADSVESIGANAFKGCSGLNELNLSEGITGIGNEAFSGCGSLKELKLPSGVTGIGSYAFYNCSSLKELKLPSGVTGIGSYAFYGCGSLKDLEIPDTVTEIGERAFYGCESFSSITIPSGVTRLDVYVFGNCTNLMSITIPKTVTSIDYTAFVGRSGSLVIYGETDSTAQSYANTNNITFVSLSSGSGGGSEGGSEGGSGESCGENLTWKLEDGVLTVEGTGKMTDFQSISAPWSSKRELIREVVIKRGVTSIGNRAFDLCKNITKVTFESNRQDMGEGILGGSGEATGSAAMDDGIKEIGKYAFGHCSSLRSIKIPYGTQKIGEYAFSGCKNLNSVQLLDGITSIGRYAFYECNSLNGIEIPKGVTKIENNTFCGCGALSSIELPEGVTEIGARAFFGCESLSGVELPDSVRTIGEFAFYNCSSLSSIVIPEGVTSLERYTFIECDKLSELTIPGTVTTIDSDCTWRKYKDAAIYGYKDTAAEEYANNRGWVFVDISDGYSGKYGDKLTWTLKDGKLTISGKGAMSSSYAPWYWLKDRIENVVVEEGVTGIGEYVFGELDSVTEITLPATVTSIDDTAFFGCSNSMAIRGYRNTFAEQYAREKGRSFIEISYDFGGTCGDNLIWRLKDGCLTISDKGSMGTSYSYELQPYKVLVEEIVIEDGITDIGTLAFNGCKNLEKVTISDGISVIGRYDFANCASLENIKLPDSITEIDEYAFYNCSSLKNINLPDGITEIDGYAFRGCSSLENIKLPDSLKKLVYGAFFNCSSLKSIEIPQGVDYIYQNLFEGCSSLENVILPDTVTVIGVKAFAGCTSLETIELPERVRRIDENAFSGCTGLRSIEIPGRLEAIESNTFHKCSSLEEVIIPMTVVSIDDSAFSECSDRLVIQCYKNTAADVYARRNNIAADARSYEDGGACGANATWSIKDGILTISGEGAMSEEGVSDNHSWTPYQRGIVEVIIEDGITKIMSDAFRNLIRLEEIEIPESVETIDGYAFDYCTGLKEIRFLGNKPRFMHSVIFRGVTANGYYPVNNPTWEAVYEDFYEGTFTWTAYYPAEGTCGDLTWTIDGAGTLAIDGNGKMASYESEEAVPWYAYKDKIKRVVIGAGVESIGAYAFSGCTGIADITFHGSMPIFGENAFYGVTADVCHPADDSSWDDVEQEMAGGILNWSDHFHIEVKDNAKAATCTEPGITSGSHCSVCGKVFIRQIEIEALGHLEKELPGACEPTCTDPGQTAHIYCARCGFVKQESERIEPTGHKYTGENYKVIEEATCTRTGRKTPVCEKCGHWDYGHQEEIPKTAHKYTGEDYKVYKEATCTEPGSRAPVCTECGALDLDHLEEIPVTEHVWQFKVLTYPTCRFEGEGTYVCKNCHTEKDGEPEIIAKKPHELVFRAEYAGTCETSGEIAHWQCSNCYKKFADENAQEELTSVKTNKLGPHHYVDGICFFCNEKEPTGTDPGTTPGTDPGTTPGTEPGTNPGTSACEHNWGTWQKISEATVFAPEKQKCICVKCGNSKEREYGNALKPYIKLTANSLKMQVKQSTNKFKVTGMARGDWLASVKSENTKVLKVSKVNRTGTFTLKAQKKTGTVKLTITLASGLKKTIKVSVGKAKVKTTKITLKSKKISLKRGKKTTLKPIIAPVTSQEKVTYKSSNKKIAAVNAKGVITAKKNGTAKITVVSGKKKVIVTVKVTK